MSLSLSLSRLSSSRENKFSLAGPGVSVSIQEVRGASPELLDYCDKYKTSAMICAVYYCCVKYQVLLSTGEEVKVTGGGEENAADRSAGHRQSQGLVGCKASITSANIGQ